MRLGWLASFLLLAFQDKLQEEYQRKLASAPQNAKGQYDLGRWCDAKKLKAEAEKAYERALQLDSEFKPAREALGHKKVLGRWVSDKLYADSSWWAHPKVEQRKVDEAVVKGVAFLLQNVGKFPEGIHTYGGMPGARVKTKLRYDELVLLTALESGFDRGDPRLKSLEQKVLSQPLDLLYHVVLRAMCLAAIDPLKHQQQLAQCAQYIVDNQNSNGGWSYGQTVTFPPSFGTTEKGPIRIETGPKARAPRQVEIKKGKNVSDKDADTDASNSQYAALGLRACLSGLVVVPKEVVLAAESYWEKNQDPDGGWGYCAGEQGRNPPNTKTFGSMTGGGVSALAILKYYRHRVWNESIDIQGSPSIVKGVAWLEKNLDYARNPLCAFGAWRYYWYYAVERSGRLLETETFGSREWYPDGAHHILGRQKPDGSWPEETWDNLPAGAMTLKQLGAPGVFYETCFAILFLRRATPKLDETIQIKTGGSADKK